MTRGVVFNIQRYSIQDGPGIRTTVFLKGCPLRCSWCHNPEGLLGQPEVVVLENRCVGCGTCREVCPGRSDASAQAGAGVAEGGRIFCTLCGACVKACPAGARQIVGRPMTVAEVVAEVEKDRLFYDDSGGGVTFSGGEPLAQPEFLKALLAHCRSRGIHTAVDTCGFCPRDELLSAASLADLFLYDLKIMDEDRHRLYTGVLNAAILDNLVALAGVHDNIWIRVPIIPGVNDDLENLQAVASLVSGVVAVRQLNLLPYHRTGTAKFKRLGRPYDLEGISDLSLGRLEEIGRIFSDHGITVKLGG